ncbi:hypothetical protein [Rhodopila sp.]|uniref:hypothetical protein n=1 Tax=Rhodopila sp. TaxID=2480087 RepID=UPI003D0A8D46
MNETLILEFQTQDAAQACLNAVNSAYAAKARAGGYTVMDDGSIIGKIDATGQNVLAALTTAWDTVKDSPDGTFYFTQPDDDAMSQLGGFAFESRAMPDAWNTDASTPPPI